MTPDKLRCHRCGAWAGMRCRDLVTNEETEFHDIRVAHAERYAGAPEPLWVPKVGDKVRMTGTGRLLVHTVTELCKNAYGVDGASFDRSEPGCIWAALDQFVEATPEDLYNYEQQQRHEEAAALTEHNQNRRDARILRIVRAIGVIRDHTRDCDSEKYENDSPTPPNQLARLPCNCGAEYLMRLIGGPYDHDIDAAEAWVRENR